MKDKENRLMILNHELEISFTSVKAVIATVK